MMSGNGITPHVTKIVKAGRLNVRPVCTTCAWKGRVCGTSDAATVNAERHVREAAAYAREAANPTPVDDSCRGGTCDGLNLCSRHSMEYQTKYGRAYNE
jgi:hypothetical protein